MKIVEVFKTKVASLVNDETQAVSEKLIELATFFYKIDRRVALAEQKYMDQLLESIDWKSSINVHSYQRRCASRINDVIGKGDEAVGAYLSRLMKEVTDLGAVEKAKTIAREVSDADGEIADDEVKYLDIVMSYD